MWFGWNILWSSIHCERLISPIVSAIVCCVLCTCWMDSEARDKKGGINHIKYTNSIVKCSSYKFYALFLFIGFIGGVRCQLHSYGVGVQIECIQNGSAWINCLPFIVLSFSFNQPYASDLVRQFLFTFHLFIGWQDAIQFNCKGPREEKPLLKTKEKKCGAGIFLVFISVLQLKRFDFFVSTTIRLIDCLP